MTRFWREPYEPARHRDHMPEIAGESGDSPQYAYFVEVGGFTFEFVGLNQLEAALDFLRSPSTGTTRISAGGGDHWEFQPWQGRLPRNVRSRSRRPAAIRALEKALIAFQTKR